MYMFCFKVLVYNTPGGKRNRGLSVIGSLRELVPPSQLTQDTVQRALLVGWCIELVRVCDGYLLKNELKDIKFLPSSCLREILSCF